jgi:trigger factor
MTTQVTVESNGELERTLKIAVPEQRISDKVESRLREISRSSNVQGFRRGKAPLKVVQQRFGARVREEVIGEIVQESFLEALNREKLRPALPPRIDPLESAVGQGLRYTARFEVLPEIVLAPFDSLQIERPACVVGADDIDRMIETLRKQRRRRNVVDRAARAGDVVTIDFTGTVAGALFEGGSATDLAVELGSGRMMDGFEAGLIGRSAGEDCRLALVFPQQFERADLAGNPVEFQVSVKQVAELELPELDDAFYRSFGVGDGGEAAFREEVRQHMGREVEVHVRKTLRDRVMDALHAANPLTLPVSLVERERERLREQLQASLKAYRIPAADEQRLLADPKMFDEQARKRVTLQLVVGEIIRAHGLRADPAKVRAAVERSAQSYEDPAAIVSWYYADRERLSDVEALVLEDEVIDRIVGQARITDVSVSFDAIVNKGQTAPQSRE